MMITFEVLGKPEPRGSKRAIPIFVRRKGQAPAPLMKNGHLVTRAIDDNPKSKPYMQAIAWEAAQLMHGKLIDGPVKLEVQFVMSRPKAQFRTSGELKFWAPAFPLTKPDATKLLRGLEDALKGIVWRDDSQVTEQHAFKIFGEPTRTIVRITEIETLTAAELASSPVKLFLAEKRQEPITPKRRTAP